MGFELPENVYRLTFADPPYAGLEVTLRGFSMGYVLASRAAARSGGDNGADPVAEEIDLLVESIEGWNAEKGGVPVPPTRENILAQDPKMVKAIIREWMAAVTGVPAPLDGASTSGEPSPEASIPMETLSPSPPS
jgi:hypothetical protein